MATVYSAKEDCCFDGESILFDTNVWITIYGNDPTRTREVYSNYYSSALSKGNQIVVSELIISEYFNRVCKIEYEIMFGRDPAEWRKFKSRRRSCREYIERVESVRDTCFHILEDCQYVSSAMQKHELEGSLTQAALGVVDMTDAALIQQCLMSNLIFVSADGDFADVDIRLVTANDKVLRRAGKK